MIPEERPDGPGSEEESARGQAAGSVRKACDPLAQTPRGRLQSRRAQVHQQINKELRMRTGAENLYRATSNAWVRETVALELSNVNSSLQLLKEELEELNGSAEADQPEGEGVTVPMIPLGLKETKELDWSTPLRELISAHFGEDSASYEAEIRELEDLRQAIRTPSRSEAGLELLMAYYNQLCLLDARFVAPTRSLGLLFQCLLRENFARAPSPDMSPASLSMLERLMTAQAQECIFEGLLLPSPKAPQGSLAREAAQVAAEYRLAHQSTAQPSIRDYVPFAWTTLVRVKAEFFRALAHYHAAAALCDSPPAEADCPATPQAVLGLPATSGPPGAAPPQEQERRRMLGKAHLKRAILGQEEALRLHAPGRALRRVDLLQAALAQALRRSLARYSELDREDDFLETAEAPDIPPETQQKPEIRAPSFSRVKVTDIFHRLGPPSVFSAKNRWRLVGPVQVAPGEAGFGLTLRGDAPVLIAAVIPGGPAAAAGLREGDYIVSLNGRPCKWWKHAEVVAQLRGAGADGVSLQAVTLLPPGAGDHRPALGVLLRGQKECGQGPPAPAPASPRPLPGWSCNTKRGKTRGRLSPHP
ncbi:rhophilin-1 isoform X3 [Suricata suricatta]|uniref:rhophilin-1 isoform X3 n=1 Tax=Suricata suricatta TaxID=37032 RepID=UPI0011557B0A|nr:rhophilin-1 isoform X3 [Suricata suricatta]